MKKITLMIMAVALAACTTQTSPERHARHFAYNASETMNGNMVTDRGGMVALNLPKFQDIYARGVADRQKGVTPAQANAVAEATRKLGQQQNKVENHYTPNKQDKWTEDAESKEAVLWYNELAGAYLDGYNGVK
ncbi:hypothetical protein CRX67_14510 [Enterobacteriaceae bacterium A-F18]|nr:hypothetical protein DFO55_10289 [Grimontella sp. AG753]QIH64201.1 hypothetical protein CRX67_14510 [Enterobacteriaceae bacterium A-F18]TCW42683.1 hypothetical protein EDC53_12328 [Phytobacter diazotrophicus]SLJ95825.1 hypothetical protein SAMN03159434_102448 [Enterobacter sp. NFR05]